MSTATQAAPWWRTAPNPQCRPWCTQEHAEDEFQAGGALLCTRAVATTDWYAVELQQCTSVDADGVEVEVLEATVWSYSSRETGECTLPELEEYATALLETARTARGAFGLGATSSAAGGAARLGPWNLITTMEKGAGLDEQSGERE